MARFIWSHLTLISCLAVCVAMDSGRWRELLFVFLAFTLAVQLEKWLDRKVRANAAELWAAGFEIDHFAGGCLHLRLDRDDSHDPLRAVVDGDGRGIEITLGGRVLAVNPTRDQVLSLVAMTKGGAA